MSNSVIFCLGFLAVTNGLVFVDPRAPNGIFSSLVSKLYGTTKIPGPNMTALVLSSIDVGTDARTMLSTSSKVQVAIFVGDGGQALLRQLISTSFFSPAISEQLFGYRSTEQNSGAFIPSTVWKKIQSTGAAWTNENRYIALADRQNATCDGQTQGLTTECFELQSSSATKLVGIAVQNMRLSTGRAIPAYFLGFKFEGNAAANGITTTRWTGRLTNAVDIGERPAKATEPESSLFRFVWLIVLGVAIGLSCCVCAFPAVMGGDWEDGIGVGLLAFAVIWIAAGVFLLFFMLVAYPNTFRIAREFNAMYKCTGVAELATGRARTVRNLIIASLVFRIIMYIYPCFLAFTEGTSWRESYGYKDVSNMFDLENYGQMCGIMIMVATFFMDMSTLIISYQLAANFRRVLGLGYQADSCMFSAPWETQTLLWVEANLLEIRSILFVVFFTHPITVAVTIGCAAACGD